MTSLKKSGYTQEFKLRVLEYYFRHGGANNIFGLKTKTAHHFSIDHKTVSRMLCNPEMVKKAQQSLSGRGSNGKFHPKVKGNNSHSLGKKSNDNKSTSAIYEKLKENDKATSKINVMELPEDPDYSLLNQTIGTSTNGAGGIAKFLTSGTEEVRQVIINECDLIYECKVCRNLFRSVVNFLAHKRLYCQEKYLSAQQPFKRDPRPSLSVPSESCEQEVEVELNESSPTEPQLKESSPPPPESKLSEAPPPESKLSEKSPPPPKKPSLESIVTNLSTRQSLRIKSRKSNSPYSYKYSPHLERLKENNENKIEETPIYLQNISGNSSAVFQSITAPVQEQRQMNSIIKEIWDKKRKEPHGRNSDDNKEKTFNNGTRSERPQSSHNKDKENTERMIYTCPICKVTFFSVSGCVKHLHRVHKKKKHQRERLREVIRYQARKRLLGHDGIAKINTTNSSSSDSYISSNIDEKKVVAVAHDCPKCGQKFGMSEAASSHVKRCMCIKEEEPKKKIEIQIRKDYKKDVLSSPILNNNLSVSTAPQSKEDILTEIKKVCKVDELLCIPCQKRFTTLNILKRHIANHIGWTRFSCASCSFKSYERYTCFQHCLSTHRGEKNANDLVLDDERLEPDNCERKFDTSVKQEAVKIGSEEKFSCASCSFKSYDRYSCLQHCISMHGAAHMNPAELVIGDKKAEDSNIDEESIVIKEEPFSEDMPKNKTLFIPTSSESKQVPQMKVNIEHGSRTSTPCLAKVDISKPEVKNILSKVAVVKIDNSKGQEYADNKSFLTKRAADLRGCNVRNISFIAVKDVVQVKKNPPPPQNEKVNGEDLGAASQTK